MWTCLMKRRLYCSFCSQVHEHLQAISHLNFWLETYGKGSNQLQKTHLSTSLRLLCWIWANLDVDVVGTMVLDSLTGPGCYLASLRCS